MKPAGFPLCPVLSAKAPDAAPAGISAAVRFPRTAGSRAEPTRKVRNRPAPEASSKTVPISSDHRIFRRPQPGREPVPGFCRKTAFSALPGFISLPAPDPSSAGAGHWSIPGGSRILSVLCPKMVSSFCYFSPKIWEVKPVARQSSGKVFAFFDASCRLTLTRKRHKINKVIPKY